jgi:hypothetical protein
MRALVTSHLIFISSLLTLSVFGCSEDKTYNIRAPERDLSFEVMVDDQEVRMMIEPSDQGPLPERDQGGIAGEEPPVGGEAGAEIAGEVPPVGGEAGTEAGTTAGVELNAGTEPEPLPYPERTPMRIKAIQPDFWRDPAELIGNNIGGVAVNLVWAAWEPEDRSPTRCDGGPEASYQGRCFTIDPAVDRAIRTYSEAGVVVTAVVYGTPAWARNGRDCSTPAPGFEVFCAPNDAEAYGRFVGFLAWRYSGLLGHGRLSDFVIHNEVNSNTWFDIGCGGGRPCDADAWVNTYADSYLAAYDAVKAEQPHAKILISLDHHFGEGSAQPNIDQPIISGQRVIEGVARRAGEREWQVAYHPYPPNLLSPDFSPYDLPKVTYGNLGALVGWLRARFPHDPHAWRVMLTESGINSAGRQSSEAAQATAVCDTLYNALGTPGVDNYIYHRMSDHPDELAGGLGLGLRRPDGSAKPAWVVWASANRDDLRPPQLSCGFEHLPYIELTRSSGRSGHWASSRRPPSGFNEEQRWHIAREREPNTTLLFECQVGQHNLLTPDVNCEGLPNLGPVGYVWEEAGDGRVALYRCYVPSTGDHLVSEDEGCEGHTTERLLGYVRRF